MRYSHLVSLNGLPIYIKLLKPFFLMCEEVFLGFLIQVSGLSQLLHRIKNLYWDFKRRLIFRL